MLKGSRLVLSGGPVPSAAGSTCRWLLPRFELPADHMQRAAVRWEEEKKVQSPPVIPSSPISVCKYLARRKTARSLVPAGNVWPSCMDYGEVRSCHAVAHSMALARWHHTALCASQPCERCPLETGSLAALSAGVPAGDTVTTCWKLGPALYQHKQHCA